MALPKNIQDREMGKFVEDASGDVSLRVELEAKDIQIGAVELKNHDSDVRAEINASHELFIKNSALETLVGEVQASPTSNSLLARLKDLLTGIVLAAGANKIGDTGLLGNTAADGSGTDYHLILDNSGRLQARGHRLADGSPARMLVDADRHGQVDVLSMPSVAVTGTFYQVTQPISASSLPLPTGAATSDKQLADGHNVVIEAFTTGFDTLTNSKVAVGASDTTVLVAGADRKFAAFINDSDEVIYLSLSATAVMNEGIRLNANGGSFEINALNLYTGEVSAICASGSKNLTISYKQ